MRLGRLDTMRKTGQASECRICKKPIEVGELHAVIMLRYGKFQEAAFQALAAMGQARTKKAGLKYRRLHLNNCLAVWAIAAHTFRSENRKAGRPKGSTQLPEMSDEERLVRRRLVRRKAQVYREILAEEDDTKGRRLIERLKDLNEQLSVDVLEGMTRRSQPEIRVLNQKLRRFMDGQGSTG